MSQEVIKEWKKLEIHNIAKDLGKRLYPSCNYIPQTNRDDGIIEATVEEHEGFDDENPIKHMRFSFDGNNLLIKEISKPESNISLIPTKNLSPVELKEKVESIFITRSQ